MSFHILDIVYENFECYTYLINMYNAIFTITEYFDLLYMEVYGNM